MAAKLNVTVYNIINYWTLSHIMCLKSHWISQWEFFLSKVNNRKTIAAIEANNETYCLQKLIEKFPLETISYFDGRTNNRYILGPT